MAGLGLIGGAGSVAYNQHGDATVQIKDKAGHVRSVQISGTGARFSCPSGTHDRLKPYDIQAGRIKLTLLDVRAAEAKLERQYPTHRAPHAVVVRYNGLLGREHRLATAFNSIIDEHNAILASDCTRDGSTGADLR